MKFGLLLSLMLASCGAPDGRLPGKQAEPKLEGAIVAPGGLAGTKWTVTAINGAAVPGGPRYFLNFDDDRIAAGFGCNSFGGAFRLNGDHLSTSDLHATEMACDGSAMTHEQQGGAILSSNMRVERASDETMRLVSEAGSIDMRRAS